MNSNPFSITVAINDPQKLFGRSRELGRIYSGLANNNRQCISLYGLQRIGKTSILKCLPLLETQQQFGQRMTNCIFVYIDLQGFSGKTADEFFETVSKNIEGQSRETLKLAHVAGKGANGFTEILEQIAEQKFYLILEIDTFDEIENNINFDENFLGFLRSLVNTHSISYIIASIKPLSKITPCSSGSSPFFNIFDNIELASLEQEDAQKLVESPASQSGCPFSPDEVDWILELAGFHPFFIQRVCSHLYKAKLASNAAEMKRKHMSDQAYSDLFPHFDHIWRNLDLKEQKLLEQIARQTTQGEKPQQRKLQALATSSLFKRFTTEKIHTESSNYFNNLEEILEKIDDTKFLGESNLASSKIVSQKYKQLPALSITEKGKIVRQVLNEALEHLSGSGQRTDIHPTWIFYNILYYRYFRYHLKNDLIATKLGFSTRQYYRERPKAIEALSQALREMEDGASNQDHK